MIALHERADLWEKRTDSLSHLALAFIIGWAACDAYYKVESLWAQRSTLEKQAVHVENVCNDQRRHAIRVMLDEQDQGIAPDWSKIKPCPKVTIPTTHK